MAHAVASDGPTSKGYHGCGQLCPPGFDDFFLQGAFISFHINKFPLAIFNISSHNGKSTTQISCLNGTQSPLCRGLEGWQNHMSRLDIIYWQGVPCDSTPGIPPPGIMNRSTHFSVTHPSVVCKRHLQGSGTSHIGSEQKQILDKSFHPKVKASKAGKWFQRYRVFIARNSGASGFFASWRLEPQ